MRLLIVSQYFWPENFRINDLASEFANRGHQVTVLTGLPNYPLGRVFDSFIASPSSFSKFLDVDVVRVPMLSRGIGGARLLLNYVSFFVSACVLGPWLLRGRRFDVVLTYQVSPVTVGLPGAFLAWVKGCPMAMWVLDLWPDTLKAIGVVKSDFLLDLVGQLVSFIFRRCDLIFAQSQTFIPKIRKLSGSFIPVMYFPSWAEDVFVERASIAAPEIPVVPGVFSLMFAGNVGEAQDFQCILGAASLLRERADIRFLIIGDGRMFDWVKERVLQLGLGPTVLLFGRYPVERMPEFFLHADAMLVTLADREIFANTIPGKIQSYLAFGKPIVAAINGEGAEVIRNSRSGIACPAGNEVGLASAISEMVALSSDERLAMGRNGFEFSQREFSRHRLLSLAEERLVGLFS